jgi:hypothetical protein
MYNTLVVDPRRQKISDAIRIASLTVLLSGVLKEFRWKIDLGCCGGLSIISAGAELLGIESRAEQKYNTVVTLFDTDYWPNDLKEKAKKSYRDPYADYKAYVRRLDANDIDYKKLVDTFNGGLLIEAIDYYIDHQDELLALEPEDEWEDPDNA